MFLKQKISDNTKVLWLFCVSMGIFSIRIKKIKKNKSRISHTKIWTVSSSTFGLLKDRFQKNCRTVLFYKIFIFQTNTAHRNEPYTLTIKKPRNQTKFTLTADDSIKYISWGRCRVRAYNQNYYKQMSCHTYNLAY